MNIVRMHKGSYGKVVAFFDLNAEGITIKGFKLIEGNDGMFVGFPSVKKGDKYEDLAFCNKEVRAEITELALEMYRGEGNSQPAHTPAADNDDIPF